MTCANMSWPYEVVPSKCAEEVPKSGMYVVALGLACAMRPGKSERKMNTTKMPKPTIAFLLDRSARQKLPRDPRRICRRWSGSSGTPLVSRMAVTTASLRGPRARVEQRHDAVSDQNGEQHGDGDEEKQRLHQWVVLIDYCLQQH